MRRISNRRKTFQTRFKLWRETAGLTLDEVTDAVNAQLEGDMAPLRVGRTTVFNYEKKSAPRAEWLAALKQAYPRLSLDWLLFGTGKMLEEIDEPLDPTDPEAAEKILARPDFQEYLGSLKDLGLLSASLTSWVVTEIEDLILEAEGVRLTFDLPRDAVSGLKVKALRSDLATALARMFLAPHNAAGGFLTFDEITREELRTYTFAFLAAIRPLVRGLRSDRVGLALGMALTKSHPELFRLSDDDVLHGGDEG